MTTTKSHRNPEYYADLIRKQYLAKFPDVPIDQLLTVGQMEGFNPPADCVDDWNAFLRESWKTKMASLRLAVPGGNVTLGGLGSPVQVRWLRLEHLNKPIELESCEVIAISEIKPYDEFVRFRCQYCHTPNDPTEWVYAKDEPHVKPGKHGCDFPQVVNATDPARDSVDSQWIRLQEIQLEGSEFPETLDCLIRKELCWSIEFHERVSFIGMLRYTKVKDKDDSISSNYRRWFDVYGVKKQDPEATIPLSEKDIAYIRSEQKKPGFVDKCVKSFCPTIWGMEPFKEAILLTLASMKLPRPARVLMVTDPSLGKSELLEYACSLVPGSVYTQMGKSSSAGLTVSSERDEETGRRYIMRGAAVQAHRSLLCIDEMQLGKEPEFGKLNDLMESGKVRFAMAGKTGYMNANPAMLMASNPADGRFGSGDQHLSEILRHFGNNLVQTVSRINMILMMRDNATEDEERAKARKVVEHNINDPLMMSRYQENWPDPSEMEQTTIQIVPGLTATFVTPAERFGTKWLRKIIKYVTNYVPVDPLTEEQQDELVDNYMRSKKSIEGANKIITIRFLRHNIAFAQYLARLQGNTRPDDQDMMHAMQLLEKSMSLGAFDPRIQEVDTNMQDGNLPQSKIKKRNKWDQWADAVRKAMLDEHGNNKGYFTADDLKFYLIRMASNTEWTDFDVDFELKKQTDVSPVKLMEKYGQGKYTPI